MSTAKHLPKWVAAALIGGIASSVQAQSLLETINNLYGSSGITVPTEAFHTAHFSSESLATLGLLTARLAPSAADFPAISTVPGFTYRFNPEIQTFERSSASLGSVFVERPQTLGDGKFDFSFAYFYIDFDELNGQKLDGLSFDLAHNDCCSNPPSPGDPPFELSTVDLTFQEFSLTSQVATFFATYGITDRWDVNFLLPLVSTDLDITARATINNEGPVPLHFFADGSTESVRSADESSTGIGDLQLRTKYHWLSRNGFNLASGLALRIDTGDEEDFQGIGATTLTPFFTLSQESGAFDFHASAGTEVNFEDSDRNRIRYGGGITWQAAERWALIADIIGSLGISEDTVTARVPEFQNLQAPTTPSGFTTVSDTIDTDIVDLAVGFKVNPYRTMVAFVNFLVPLNEDGLRADFIPVAGLEMSL